MCSKSKLLSLLATVVCALCHSPVEMIVKNHSVLFFDFVVRCNCSKSLVTAKRDEFERTGTDGKKGKFSKRTIGGVYATMCSGGGHAQFSRITTSLGLKYMAKSQFHKYKNLIYDMAAEVTYEHLKIFCAQAVYDYYVNILKVIPDKDGIIDILVTFDGSWKTRGFTSNLGCGLVIEAFTGILLDFIAFSKICTQCNTYKNKLAKKKITKEEYELWEKNHKDSGRCEQNFWESSGMMEVRAAEIMWKRSVEKYKIRYKVMISDGDSKAFNNLNEIKPYGKYFKIEKKDCLNHIGKRMGHWLRKIRDEPLEAETPEEPEVIPELSEVKKGKKKTVKKSAPLRKNLKRLDPFEKKTVPVKKYTSMKGKNGLRDIDIACHQKYYKIAIRSNFTVKDMKNSIEATWDHFTSTDVKPKHEKCNVNWCWFRKYEKEVAEERKEFEEKKDAREKEYEENAAKKSKGFYSVKAPKHPAFVTTVKYAGHDSMNSRIKFEEDSVPYKKIRAIYAKLSRTELLKRCEDKFTQNPNESFHSRIWRMCPKHKYFSFFQMQFAICQNILIYHLGYELGNLLSHFGIETTKGMQTQWKLADYDRTQVVKVRKQKRVNFTPKEGQFDRDESVYMAGGFDS